MSEDYKKKPREEWTPEDHAKRNADNDPVLKLRQENEELKAEIEELKAGKKKKKK